MSATDHLSSAQFPSPEDKRHYNRGFAASKRMSPTALERADMKGEPNSWYDGYMDHATDREKGHSLTCRKGDHGPECWPA